MKCSRCGNLFPPNAQFCPTCGMQRPVNQQRPVPPPPPQQRNSSQRSTAGQQPRKSGTKKSLIIGVALVVILLFLCSRIGSSTTNNSTYDTSTAGSSTSDNTASTAGSDSQLETPVAPPAQSSGGSGSNFVEISGFPWSSSGNQDSNVFQINGQLALHWQCIQSGASPFTIQVWKYGHVVNDQPIGPAVIDATPNCQNGSTGQVLDFNGQSFQAYLGVSGALGNWTIDAATYSS